MCISSVRAGFSVHILTCFVLLLLAVSCPGVLICTKFGLLCLNAFTGCPYFCSKLLYFEITRRL